MEYRILLFVPITMGTMKPVAPPENVLVMPNSVPARLGARSTWLDMWPELRAPLKKNPVNMCTAFMVI